MKVNMNIANNNNSFKKKMKWSCIITYKECRKLHITEFSVSINIDVRDRTQIHSVVVVTEVRTIDKHLWKFYLIVIVETLDLEHCWKRAFA